MCSQFSLGSPHVGLCPFFPARLKSCFRQAARHLHTRLKRSMTGDAGAEHPSADQINGPLMNLCGQPLITGHSRLQNCYRSLRICLRRSSVTHDTSSRRDCAGRKLVSQSLRSFRSCRRAPRDRMRFLTRKVFSVAFCP